MTHEHIQGSKQLPKTVMVSSETMDASDDGDFWFSDSFEIKDDGVSYWAEHTCNQEQVWWRKQKKNRLLSRVYHGKCVGPARISLHVRASTIWRFYLVWNKCKTQRYRVGGAKGARGADARHQTPQPDRDNARRPPTIHMKHKPPEKRLAENVVV